MQLFPVITGTNLTDLSSSSLGHSKIAADLEAQRQAAAAQRISAMLAAAAQRDARSSQQDQFNRSLTAEERARAADRASREKIAEIESKRTSATMDRWNAEQAEIARQRREQEAEDGIVASNLSRVAKETMDALTALGPAVQGETPDKTASRIRLQRQLDQYDAQASGMGYARGPNGSTYAPLFKAPAKSTDVIAPPAPSLPKASIPGAILGKVTEALPRVAADVTSNPLAIFKSVIENAIRNRLSKSAPQSAPTPTNAMSASALPPMPFDYSDAMREAGLTNGPVLPFALPSMPSAPASPLPLRTDRSAAMTAIPQFQTVGEAYAAGYTAGDRVAVFDPSTGGYRTGALL